MKHATDKTNQLNITRFHISGRRWFQKSAGNTYHSVRISALSATLDRWVDLGGVDFAYGYDEGYLQTGVDWLIENGYLNDGEHYQSGGKERYGWQYRKENNIDNTVQDVNRKKDL